MKGYLLRVRGIRKTQLVLSGPAWLVDAALKDLGRPTLRGAAASPERFSRVAPNNRQEFCTSVHRFAQRFEQNLIDGANGKHYLAHRLNREALELYGSI